TPAARAGNCMSWTSRGASPRIRGASASTGAEASRATASRSSGTGWRAGAAGGGKRGKQSAGVVIQGEEEWSDLALRVDDHTDPLAELERLEQVSREGWGTFRPFLPQRKTPARRTA